MVNVRPDMHLTDIRQVLDFPELIEKGLAIKAPMRHESREACVFASGPASVSAQFASDVSARTPFRVIPALDERVPGWLAEGKDAIVVSYSGDEARMIEAYRTLKGRGCAVHCITSGGTLGDMCREDGNDLVRMPAGMTPRSAVGMEIGAIASLLRSAGAPFVYDSLKRTTDALKERRDRQAEDTEEASRIAGLLYGKTPAIYSPIDSIAAARRWKYSLDEDSGSLSIFGEMPDFDHNEIVGWADLGAQTKDVRLVLLRMATGIPEYEYNIRCMEEVLHEYRRDITVIDYRDKEMVLAELEAMLFGDMVSLEIRKRREAGGP